MKKITLLTILLASAFLYGCGTTVPPTTTAPTDNTQQVTPPSDTTQPTTPPSDTT